MRKYLVTLETKIDVIVAAKSKKQVINWLRCTTPDEAAKLSHKNCEYDEQIIYRCGDNVNADIKIK
jgi:hypothetical protein